MKIEECTDPQHGPPPSGEHRFKALYIIGAVLLGLFILGFLPRYFHRNHLEEQSAKTLPPHVLILKMKPNEDKEELVLPSSLDALRITPIWARTNGYLTQFYVDIGDHVTEGQLLALIDTPEVDQELGQARADLNSSLAKLEIARISAERWEDLFAHNPEAISKQEVDERKSVYESATADVAAAEANVKRLEQLQGFQKIYAPFDGIIIERDIDLGSLITAGNNTPQQLFKIAKTDILRAFTSVPQYYYRSIQDGMPAYVTVKEFPGRKFSGKVVRNAKALDPTARTLLTEVHIDNQEGTLLTGLYTQVHFLLDSSLERFIVPTEAIIVRTGEPQVAIVKPDQTIQLKTVQIGRDYGSKMEIIEGLQANDQVVINPNERIRDGVTVEIVTQNTAGH